METQINGLLKTATLIIYKGGLNTPQFLEV